MDSASSSDVALTPYYLQAICDKPGTAQEGWYLNNSLISLDSCANKVIACENQGTAQEGWYSYSKVSSLALQSFLSTTCAKTTEPYQCNNGNWYLGSTLLTTTASGSCTTDVSSCEFTMGFYSQKAYTISNRTLLQNTNCSSKLKIYE